MTIQRQLAKSILESIYEDMEARAHGSNYSRHAQYAGNATIALGFDELTKQFASLLDRYQFNKTEQLSSLKPRSFVSELDSLVENRKQFPVFPEDYATQLFQKFNRNMLPYTDDGFTKLIKEAETESHVEDIAVSLAILGRYDKAMDTCRQLRCPYAQDHVRYIICIEHYRRNQIQEARAVRSTLTARQFTSYTGVQFALGICNHVPWGVYPYSDC